MSLPIDAEIHSEKKGNEEIDLDTTIANHLCSREKAFSKVKVNINDAQKKQKKTYDRKHLCEELPIGALILVENTKDKQRKGGKLNPA